MKQLARVLMAVAGMTPVVASAYVGTPTISPALPTTRSPITVIVPAGFCHGFFESPKEQLVTVAPGQLRLMTNGIALPPGHPFCVASEFVYRFEIGTLPAGNYNLQIFITDDFWSPEPVGFGSVSFVVTEPTAVPSMSVSGGAFAAAVLGLIGLLSLRRRLR